MGREVGTRRGSFRGHDLLIIVHRFHSNKRTAVKLQQRSRDHFLCIGPVQQQVLASCLRSMMVSHDFRTVNNPETAARVGTRVTRYYFCDGEWCSWVVVEEAPANIFSS